VGKHLDAFSEAHHEFMEILEEEERSFPLRNGIGSYRTNIMRKVGRSETFGISKP
jgi:hypothetical protein